MQDKTRQDKTRQDKTRQDPVTDEFMDLRSRAEAAMLEKPIDHLDVSTLPTKELQALVHELRVRQIELEMQNEELKRIQRALEDSRNEFQDLYDFAPVGYFIITPQGFITRVNLTGASLLRVYRPELIGRGFGHFIAPESLEQWDKHILTVLGTEDRQTCDLTLQREDGSSFQACLESIRMNVSFYPERENRHNYVIRMAVNDITERKFAEDAILQSQENFRRFFDTMDDIIVVGDSDGRIIHTQNRDE